MNQEDIEVNEEVIKSDIRRFIYKSNEVSHKEYKNVYTPKWWTARKKMI